MKCPTCKKDFAKGVKAAYKLGLLKGENRLQVTINCIKKTNRHLFGELLRLDKEQPNDSVCIRMRRREAERLVTYLLKHKHTYQAEKIQKLIKSQIDKPAFDEFIEKIEQNRNR